MAILTGIVLIILGAVGLYWVWHRRVIRKEAHARGVTYDDLTIRSERFTDKIIHIISLILIVGGVIYVLIGFVNWNY